MKNLFLGCVLALISTLVNSQTQQAYVAPGDLRTFLDYNLGADTSLPSNIPSSGIKGDKYQWGVTAKIDNSTDWSASPATDAALSDAVKTANDPCPTGYRLPTGAEWQGVIANNSVQWVGNFYEDGWGSYNRHTSGLLINNSLFLPSAGSINVGGEVASNNASGVYWSSTGLGYLNYSSALVFYWAGQMPSTSKANPLYKSRGGNIRCIQQNTSPRAMVINTKEVKDNKDMIIYPNPTSYSFKVKGNDNKKVQVYNNMGKLLLSKNLKGDESVNIESFNKGVYYVSITKEGKQYKELLIKN